MQIRENKNFDSRDEWMNRDAFSDSIGLATISTDSDESEVENFLDVRVEAGQSGLHVLRVGEKSPLYRLRPLGSYTMRGLVETGDRIVAIDGVLSYHLSDLSRIVCNRRFCEVSIFDHRTRLTVTWKIQVHDLLEAA